MLVGVLSDDGGRRVLRGEAVGELSVLGVEAPDLLGVLELLRALGHHGRPFLVERDEVLRDLLPLGRVRGQQRGIAAALEHLTQLPGQVPAVLHGDVHALAGLGAVGVAGVAGDEDARVLAADPIHGDVVELLGHRVAHLVDAEPGHLLHLDRVRVQDLIGALGGLLDGRGAQLLAVAVVDIAQGHVEPEQEAALTGDQQDRAVLVREDPALLADVREVGLGQHVHHRPGVSGRVLLDLDVRAVANPAAGSVVADDVLGAHRALAALGIAQQHLDRMLLGLVHLQLQELISVVGRDPGRAALGVLGEVVDDPCLVDDQERELAHARGRVLGSHAAHDPAGILGIGSPEVHIDQPVRLGVDAIEEAVGLEGLAASGPESVGAAYLQTARAGVDDPRADAGVARELGSLDDPGRSRAHDEHVHGVRQVRRPIDSCAGRLLHERIMGDVSVMVVLHSAPLSFSPGDAAVVGRIGSICGPDDAVGIGTS